MIEVCCNCEVSKDMPQHGKPLLEASSTGCLLSSDLAVTALLSLSFSVKVLVHNLSFKTQASTYTSSGIGGSRFYLPLIGRKPLHHFLFSETWVEDDLNVIAFNIVLEVSEIVLISFNLFFFCPL